MPGKGRFPLARLGPLCLAVLAISAGGVAAEPLWTLILVLGGIASLPLFLIRDAWAGAGRLLPRGPADPRRPSGAALLMVFTFSMATIAITAYGPLLITAVHKVSALTAGYVLACSTIGWTVTAILVSGSSERFDRVFISCGMLVVTLSIVGFVFAVPHGPIWLIAVCASLEGGGFGMAWTFVLRRTAALAEPDDVRRIAGGIPTVQRLGYALGAAYVGMVANASGDLATASAEAAANVSRAIFVACLPIAMLGLLAMIGFVRAPPRSAGTRR